MKDEASIRLSDPAWAAYEIRITCDALRMQLDGYSSELATQVMYLAMIVGELARRLDKSGSAR